MFATLREVLLPWMLVHRTGIISVIYKTGDEKDDW